MAANPQLADSALGSTPNSAAPTFSPLYEQIKALIMQGLQSGAWKPGELIPSEIELAARFKVSQGTVRKAIDELAAEHLLIRRQGKGTFVATHQEARAHFRFLRLRPDAGEPHPLESKVLDCKRLRAPADIARQLELKAGDTAAAVRRVLSADGAPLVLDEIWLPGQLFKGLSAERVTDYKGPMYALFETEFGVRMIRAQEKLKAVYADTEVAEALAVKPGTAVLFVERLSFTYSDKPVELRRGWYQTEHFHYLNELI
ncbi:MAG: GntR family transcriptional regulator [Burkholderiaceae bacterium]